MREVFSSVAGRYDLMNDLMSGGVHRLWKDVMVECLIRGPGWRRARCSGRHGGHCVSHRRGARQRGGAAEIAVCDINLAMLDEGMRRARLKGEAGIAWLCGDAEALPIPEASIDAYTIAFGIRNVTRVERALSEARRVLKPGGRFVPGILADPSARSWGAL